MNFSNDWPCLEVSCCTAPEENPGHGLDISWHGGYEFILFFSIKVVWKSFRHNFLPFLRVGLVNDYLMQSDLALNS